jgi:hypothetical protein
MLLDVVTVKPQPDYQLELKFANGERRRFDMRPLLALKPWSRIASPHLFELAKVEYGTVVWPGEIDIAPETLYDDSIPLCVNEESASYEPKQS